MGNGASLDKDDQTPEAELSEDDQAINSGDKPPIDPDRKGSGSSRKGSGSSRKGSGTRKKHSFPLKVRRKSSTVTPISIKQEDGDITKTPKHELSMSTEHLFTHSPKTIQSNESTPRTPKIMAPSPKINTKRRPSSTIDKNPRKNIAIRAIHSANTNTTTTTNNDSSNIEDETKAMNELEMVDLD